MRTEQQLATGHPWRATHGEFTWERSFTSEREPNGVRATLLAACTLASKDEAFGIVEPVNVTPACVTKAGAFSGQSVRGPAERTVRAPHRLQLDARARRRRALPACSYWRRRACQCEKATVCCGPASSPKNHAVHLRPMHAAHTLRRSCGSACERLTLRGERLSKLASRNLWGGRARASCGHF